MSRKYGKDSPTPAQLRKLRESRWLTQSQAADFFPVSLRTWQNWESGKHEMHPIFWDCFRRVWEDGKQLIR